MYYDTRKTLVITTSHRGICDKTQECIQRLSAPWMKMTGDGCIDRARSTTFDKAVRFLQSQTSAHIETVLLIDDDMVFETTHAYELLDECMRLQWPVSARYAKESGALAGKSVNGGATWFFGLGFMAIPSALLLQVSAGLERIGTTRVWCRTGELAEFPGEWKGEDDFFCSLFIRKGVRGVYLSKTTVGHLKLKAVFPSEEG